jgi:hypothetical protein
MSTNIEQVREHLLGTLADLRCREHPMEVDRARAIAQVAGVLVETARVEVEFLKVTDGESSGFLDTKSAAPQLPAPAPTGELLPGVTTRVHRIR